MKTAEIIPAILAKTRNDALRKLRLAEKSAKKVQVDIIDGSFVRNKTVTPDAFSVRTKLALEFHLMVKHPEAYVHEIAAMPHAKTVIFHLEAVHSHDYALALIEHIKFHQLHVGIALNPETPASYVKRYLPLIDQVLVMTVHPGFMGQGFLNMSRKIRQLREWAPKIDIEVDGGIHHGTAKLCRNAGANLFVVGSALYDVKDFKKAYAVMKREVK
ncbi:MAG TPA: ribulose-phosphate 3-epimerase [Candidatus Binatia bacterium]|nr:ribulose-phosphate 3-epimerase [Candidatus Binatia bacterium]